MRNLSQAMNAFTKLIHGYRDNLNEHVISNQIKHAIIIQALQHYAMRYNRRGLYKFITASRRV